MDVHEHSMKSVHAELTLNFYSQLLNGPKPKGLNMAIYAGAFNEQHYVNSDPNIVLAIAKGEFATGWDHFLKHGKAEGRNPNADLDTAYYAAQNPDVRAEVEAGRTTYWDHYLSHGAAEGRAPNATIGVGFNEAVYLALDAAEYGNGLAAAIAAGGFTNAFGHYLVHGIS